MKKLIIGAGVAALALASTAAQAQDKLTLQLKWVTQAQFAGYFVAKDKGFYKDEKLDVTIKPGGPDVAPPQVIAGGGADVVIDWMPSALATREKGIPLVNIAQVFKRSGMMLTCRNDSGIKTPADFKGKTLGVWFGGNEYPFLSWMDKLKLKSSGAGADITVLKQGFNVDPLLQKQAACISTMTYNEYWQVIDAGMKPRRPHRVQIRGTGCGNAGRRHLHRRREAEGPGDGRQAGALPESLDEGLGLRHQEPARGGQDRPRQRQHRRPDGTASDAHDGRDRQAASPTSPRASATSRKPTTSAPSTSCSRAAPTRSSPRSRRAPTRTRCGTRRLSKAHPRNRKGEASASPFFMERAPSIPRRVGTRDEEL